MTKSETQCLAATQRIVRAAPNVRCKDIEGIAIHHLWGHEWKSTTSAHREVLFSRKSRKVEVTELDYDATIRRGTSHHILWLNITMRNHWAHVHMANGIQGLCHDALGPGHAQWQRLKSKTRCVCSPSWMSQKTTMAETPLINCMSSSLNEPVL